MAEPERRTAGIGGALALLVAGAGLLLGCGSSVPAPKSTAPAASLPPQSVSQSPLPPSPQGEQPVAVPTPPRTTVIIESGEAQPETKQNIVETARAERARRRDAEPPVVVLNDKNLGAFAAGQNLTVATPTPAPAAAPTNKSAPAPLDPASEATWRQRGRDLRREWREAYDRIADLQREAAKLRDRFYATDDPVVRDSQVKPQWDRVLEQIRVAEQVAEDGRRRVEDFLDEGRRAGALPGWLREGLELEPTPPPPPDTEVEPGEPVTVPEPPPA